MTNMGDLGLRHVKDTSNYDVLCAQIYEYYEVQDILDGGRNFTQTANFPEPLWIEGCQLDAASPQPLDKKQFFRHLLHADAKELLPFVDAVLAAEHKNSPIFAASTNLDIDRESLAQLADRAFRLAKAHGITPSPQAKALLNMLMLMELLV